MPASFVSATTKAGGGAEVGVTSASTVVNLPGSWAVDDFAFALVEWNTTDMTMVPPAGWTAVALPGVVGGANQRKDLYYRKLTAGEPGSDAAWTLTRVAVGTIGPPEVTIAAWRGALAVERVASAVAAPVGGGPSTGTTPSTTSDRATNLAVSVYRWVGPSNDPTASSGQTMRNLQNEVLFADKAVGVVTTGALTFTHPFANSGDHGGHTVILTSNVAPNAPAVSIPASVNRLGDVAVTVAFSDADAGNTPSAARIRFRRTDTLPAWTEIYVAGPVGSVTIPAGTLAVAPYEVQGQSTDQDGLVGPWSGSVFFTAVEPPPGPVFTAPTAGATVTSPNLTATVSSTGLDALQWRVVADAAGSPDVATVLIAGATIESAAARSFDIAGLPNSTTVHIQARERNAGLWSSWISVLVNVAFTPPAIPTATVLASSAEGAISVTATHPAPSGGQPAVVTMSVYRRVTGSSVSVRLRVGAAPTATFIDYTPASGVDYEYAVEAVAATGASAMSDWTAGAGATAPITYYGGGYDL